MISTASGWLSLPHQPDTVQSCWLGFGALIFKGATPQRQHVVGGKAFSTLISSSFDSVVGSPHFQSTQFGLSPFPSGTSTLLKIANTKVCYCCAFYWLCVRDWGKDQPAQQLIGRGVELVVRRYWGVQLLQVGSSTSAIFCLMGGRKAICATGMEQLMLSLAVFVVSRSAAKLSSKYTSLASLWRRGLLTPASRRV